MLIPPDTAQTKDTTCVFPYSPQLWKMNILPPVACKTDFRSGTLMCYPQQSVQNTLLLSLSKHCNFSMFFSLTPVFNICQYVHNIFCVTCPCADRIEMYQFRVSMFFHLPCPHMGAEQLRSTERGLRGNEYQDPQGWPNLPKSRALQIDALGQPSATQA